MKVKDLPRTAWMGNIDAGIVKNTYGERKFSSYYATIEDIYTQVEGHGSGLWEKILNTDVKFIYDLPRYPHSR